MSLQRSWLIALRKCQAKRDNRLQSRRTCQFVITQDFALAATVEIADMTVSFALEIPRFVPFHHL